LVLWPITVTHKIDESSPFYSLGPADLLASKFEIILSLIGVTEETGNTVQVEFFFCSFEKSFLILLENLNIYIK